MTDPRDHDSAPFHGMDRRHRSGLRKSQPRRVFLGVAAFSAAVFYGLLLVSFWGLYPRLIGIHPLAADIFGSLISCVAATLFSAVALIAASLLSRRAWRISEWVAARLENAFPLLALVGKAFKIEESILRESLNHVMADMTRARLTVASSGRVLVILPQCVDSKQVSQVRALCSEYDADFFHAESFSAARDHVAQARPAAVIAVACPKESVPQARDLGYSVPAEMLQTKTVEGKVTVDVHALRTVIHDVKVRFEIRPASKPAPVTASF